MDIFEIYKFKRFIQLALYMMWDAYFWYFTIKHVCYIQQEPITIDLTILYDRKRIVFTFFYALKH